MAKNNMITCKACEKEIAKGAKKCIHCGKDQRNFFMKHKIVSAILVIALLGGLGNALGSGDTSEVASNSVNKEEAIVVSAADLSKAYEENEVSADKIYKDNMVSVTGTIIDIGVILERTYIVLDSEVDLSLTDVQCFFYDKNEIDKIADLDKGDVVTIEGKVDGKVINVSIEKCIIK